MAPTKTAPFLINLGGICRSDGAWNVCLACVATDMSLLPELGISPWHVLLRICRSDGARVAMNVKRSFGLRFGRSVGIFGKVIAVRDFGINRRVFGNE